MLVAFRPEILHIKIAPMWKHWGFKSKPTAYEIFRPYTAVLLRFGFINYCTVICFAASFTSGFFGKYTFSKPFSYFAWILAASTLSSRLKLRLKLWKLNSFRKDFTLSFFGSSFFS